MDTIRYSSIRFIDFMLKGKCFLDYINLFFPNEYEKNDKITLKYFPYLKKLFLNRFLKD